MSRAVPRDGVMSGDEYGLFRQAIHYNEDGVETGGGREFFYEVHRN